MKKNGLLLVVGCLFFMSGLSAQECSNVQQEWIKAIKASLVQLDSSDRVRINIFNKALSEYAICSAQPDSENNAKYGKYVKELAKRCKFKREIIEIYDPELNKNVSLKRYIVGDQEELRKSACYEYFLAFIEDLEMDTFVPAFLRHSAELNRDLRREGIEVERDHKKRVD